jgi:hypothetical protein
MQKKSIIIMIVAIVIVLGLITAYLAYKYYKQEPTTINQTDNSQTLDPQTPHDEIKNTPPQNTTPATNQTPTTTYSGGGGSRDSVGGGGGTTDSGSGVVLDKTPVNIASFAEVKTNLYSPFKERMTDKVIGKGLIQDYYRYGFEQVPFNQTAEFKFKQPVKIRKIRFSLPPKDYNLLADTNGDGNYDTELAEVINASGAGFWWQEQ